VAGDATLRQARPLEKDNREQTDAGDTASSRYATANRLALVVSGGGTPSRGRAASDAQLGGNMTKTAVMRKRRKRVRVRTTYY